MASFSEQTVSTSISLQSVLESNQPNGVEDWLTTNGPDSEPGLSAVAQACRMGRLDVVESLRNQGYAWDVHACCAAAQYGHLDVLKYLHANGCPWDEKAMIYAARGGQLECLKYLHEQGCPWDKLVFLEFIGLNYAVFMRYKGAHPWKDAEPLVIPSDGYVSCLQYALENGCPVHPEAFETFAYYGRLDCLQLMHQHGAKWGTEVTCAAASMGHLSSLKYLHESGCPWDKTSTIYTVFNGHVDCLRYAIEHRCPYDEKLLVTAANTNSLGCLTYLIEEQHLSMGENGSIFRAAFLKGHVRCVQFLASAGCALTNFNFELPRKTDKDFWRNSSRDADFLACIQCAVEHGWQPNAQLMEAISERNIETSELCLPLCFAYAQQQKWL